MHHGKRQLDVFCCVVLYPRLRKIQLDKHLVACIAEFQVDTAQSGRKTSS